MGGAGIVPQVLDEYGAVTRAVLQRYLAPRPPERHLYDLVADYPRRGGPHAAPEPLHRDRAGLRRVASRTPSDSAVALELLHNAFLVHDDIEDESDERRGRPTLHALHGVPIAVNVGDALALLGLRRAHRQPRLASARALTLRILEEAERMARESVEGQAIELGWRRDNAVDVTEADYLDDGAQEDLLVHDDLSRAASARSSARAASIDLDRFIRFGFFLGAAFQIQDDLLNLVGDARRYGKELGGDIGEGKRTLMLIHLLREASPGDRTRIRGFLARPRELRRKSEVAWLRTRMEAYGSIDYARGIAHALAGAARHESEAVYAGLPERRDRQFIRALPEWMLSRS